MFSFCRELIDLKDDSFAKMYSRIEKYESISDNMELQIGRYLNQISDAHLSPESKGKIRAMLREISELESIGDSCYNLARAINRGKVGKEAFTEEQLQHLLQMFTLNDEALTLMNQMLNGRKADFDTNKSYNIEHEINNYRDQLKSQNINDIDNHQYDYTLGTIYMDIINECEKLGDYVMNVVEARMGSKHR